MWFHAGPASVSQRCRDSEHEMVGEVAEIQNIVQEGEIRGDTLHMVARMWDYQGKLRSKNSNAIPFFTSINHHLDVRCRWR